MVQISGKLKLESLALDAAETSALKVVGLIAECQLIDSYSTILELSMPQTVFTSTMSLDNTILSVETKYVLLRGYR